jgi:hypothetical protein
MTMTNWTIYNRSHQRLAEYRRASAMDALHAFMRDQMIQSAQFRGIKVVPLADVYAAETKAKES